MEWNEIENINTNSGKVLPPDPFVRFVIKTDEAMEKLGKVKAVMLSISRHTSDDWPDDNTWKKELPPWFLAEIMSKQPAELLRNPDLWDYSSWVDAMKHRGWYWYGSFLTEKGFEIILIPYDFPFIVDPLEYIIYETGVKPANIKYIDFI